MLVGKLHDLNTVFVERVQATTGAFSSLTETSMAHHMAEYTIYGQLLKQSTLWAFIDSFRIFGLLCFAVIPLLLLFRRSKKSN